MGGKNIHNQISDKVLLPNYRNNAQNSVTRNQTVDFLMGKRFEQKVYQRR